MARPQTEAEMVIPPRAFCTSLTLHGTRGQLERGGNLVPDLHRERLAERTLVAEAREVDLQRLRLEAERLRPVLDRRGVEVGLVRDRAQRRELVAHQLDGLDARVREGLETDVGVASSVAERDELVAP